MVLLVLTISPLTFFSLTSFCFVISVVCVLNFTTMLLLLLMLLFYCVNIVFKAMDFLTRSFGWSWMLSAVVYVSISICEPPVAAVANFSVEYFCRRFMTRLSVTCLLLMSQASPKTFSMARFKGAKS